MKDQRARPRVRMDPELRRMSAELDAVVQWPNLEISSLLNLSWTGAAVARPGLFDVANASSLEIELRFGRAPGVIVRANRVWCRAEAVGLKFGALPPAAYALFDEYLGPLLLGSALTAIGRSHFSPDAAFADWFQGPEQTHVLLWRRGPGDITRAQVEFGPERVTFERGQNVALGHAETRRALLLLSQMDKAGVFVKEFVRTLSAGVRR